MRPVSLVPENRDCGFKRFNPLDLTAVNTYEKEISYLWQEYVSVAQQLSYEWGKLYTTAKAEKIKFATIHDSEVNRGEDQLFTSCHAPSH